MTETTEHPGPFHRRRRAPYSLLKTRACCIVGTLSETPRSESDHQWPAGQRSLPCVHVERTPRGKSAKRAQAVHGFA